MLWWIRPKDEAGKQKNGINDDDDARGEFECEHWTSHGQLKEVILTFILNLFYCGD